MAIKSQFSKHLKDFVLYQTKSRKFSILTFQRPSPSLWHILYIFTYLPIFFQNLFSSTKKVLSQKESRTTWTLALVCFCYFLFVMPITIVNILHDFGVHGILDSYCYLFAFCIYWLQYSLNFFIYAARSEQYRRAYLFFLKEVCTYICT